MLERARERGVYDELQAGEMLETMADLARDAAGRETPFDLILAADVLIYLGDLGPFFAACRTALAQREGRGGYVLVSTEGLADGEAGAGQEYVLRPTGRYAHAPAYVGAAAGRSGFRVAARRTVPLRWHGQVMLPGDVFLLCLEG
jgi:predicted TPR repeat methyltransferase